MMSAENMDRLRRVLQAAEAETSPPPPAWVAEFRRDGHTPDVAVYMANLLEKLAVETGEPERSALLAACVGPGTRQERERCWIAFLAAHRPAWLRDRRRATPGTISDR